MARTIQEADDTIAIGGTVRDTPAAVDAPAEVGPARTANGDRAAELFDAAAERLAGEAPDDAAAEWLRNSGLMRRLRDIVVEEADSRIEEIAAPQTARPATGATVDQLVTRGPPISQVIANSPKV